MTVLTDLPQISSPLPWHGREWPLLTEQLAGGKLPHALLLVGGQGLAAGHLAAEQIAQVRAETHRRREWSCSA